MLDVVDMPPVSIFYSVSLILFNRWGRCNVFMPEPEGDICICGSAWGGVLSVIASIFKHHWK